MPVTLDDLLDDALAEPGNRRIAAAEGLLPYLTASQRSRVWGAATAAAGFHRTAVLFTALAPTAAPHELRPALAALRALPPSSSARAHGLAALLPHLADSDRPAVEDELIATVATTPDRSELLHVLAPGLSPGGLARAVRAALDAGDPVAATRPAQLPADLRRAVLAACAALADEQARAAALGAWAPWLSAAEAEAVAPAARTITAPDRRAALLTGLAGPLPALAAEALDAVLEFRGDDQWLWFLPDLAARLVPGQLDVLLDRLAAATRATTRMWTIGALAPHLDAAQHRRALAAVGLPDPPDIWLVGAARFLPYLPPDLLADMQDFVVRLMTDSGVGGGVGDLLPHLRPEQLDRVLRLTTAPGGDLAALGELVPHLSAEQVTRTLDAVLARPDPAERAWAVADLAPRLDAAQARRAAAAVPDDGDPVAVVAARTALAPRLGGDARRSVVGAGARAAERLPGDAGAVELVELAGVSVDEAQRDELLRRAVRGGGAVVRGRIAALLAGCGNRGARPAVDL
ncbi:hypothetical protein Sya03_45240 [Spirilliplanes yamanashiensis]|uniref:Uncharacterized protein n=1 Tax=Spirilliplanes yamanashiensis TaxID=42233 RepID=A0A8J4DKD3_9ACTN|nr:hypothetical protein Sya03_45240 [Spirilliplanes yamanashiensis]